MSSPKTVLNVIEEGISGFSKGQKLIAQYILAHYDEAAYMTASKLGTAVGVSESTVVRFATELGYEGYPEMQSSLRDIIRTRLTAVQRVEVTSRIMGSNVLDTVFGADLEKIQRTLGMIDRQAFDVAVDTIINAKRIFILGMRSSEALATFLNLNFRMMFDNVIHIQVSTESEMFEQLMDIGQNDVLISISFPRYSARTVRAVEFAKDAGADVVAVTDAETSPIAAYADQLLLASSDMLSFADSLVAPLSIMNALIVAASMRRPEEVRAKLEKLEKIWDTYSVYDKSNK